MSKKVVADLDCGHSTIVTVGTKTEGDDAYCKYDGFSMICTIWWEEWRVVCLTCQYGRWCGQSESAAKSAAYLHSRYKQIKHPCHIFRDTITASGGTPRKKIVSKYGTVLTDSNEGGNVPISKAVEQLPPPF